MTMKAEHCTLSQFCNSYFGDTLIKVHDGEFLESVGGGWHVNPEVDTAFCVRGDWDLRSYVLEKCASAKVVKWFAATDGIHVQISLDDAEDAEGEEDSEGLEDAGDLVDMGDGRFMCRG